MQTNASLPQPAPQTGGRVVLEAVMADLQERAETGKAKYGTYLTTGNGRNPLWDAYQEALDLAMYLRQALLEQEGGVTFDLSDGREMTPKEYVLFLQIEIMQMENNLAVLREFLETPHFDPNYRLQWGKLLQTVALYKDLADMCGHEVDEDFYPDTMSLLEQEGEG